VSDKCVCVCTCRYVGKDICPTENNLDACKFELLWRCFAHMSDAVINGCDRKCPICVSYPVDWLMYRGISC
jgi:hypothetical protein